MAATSTVEAQALPFPELRPQAAILNGDECLKKSVELFERFGLPAGLLPLEDVIEGGWVEETGFVWMQTSRKQQHLFEKAKKLCTYSEIVSCFLEQKKMKKISGVKAKDLFVWVPVNEITLDDATPPKLHFKSLAGLSRSFPPEFFGRGA